MARPAGRRTPDRPTGALAKRSIHVSDVRRARELIAGVDHESVADFFAALADPNRLRIVHVLLQQEMCTSDLAVTLSIGEPLVSQHLRVLRDLELVESRRAGRVVYYSAPNREVGRVLAMGLKLQGNEADSRLGRPLTAGRAEATA
ncbi:MAG TPA: metalloregulator ArsR/SmtB family transcription factor [Candidatus Dormibacteraeota bacterium]|nr:metalloregulator ArsR/SmtB family transcription factor [Candidatus Dormibacteraeota bacterium]